jgi:CRP-like cAMP-binding protein
MVDAASSSRRKSERESHGESADPPHGSWEHRLEERLSSLESKLDALLDRGGGVHPWSSSTTCASPRGHQGPSACIPIPSRSQHEQQSAVVRPEELRGQARELFGNERASLQGMEDDEEDDDAEAELHLKTRVLRNRLSLSAREEKQVHKSRFNRCHCLFYPHSQFRLTWDLVSCFLTLFVALTLPYRLAFTEEWSLGWYTVEFLIDIFFISDIIINLRTVVVAKDGTLATSPLAIFHEYARTWLAVDLIASLPLDWFRVGISFVPPPHSNLSMSGGEGGSAQVTQLLRTLKLFRLLRLLRVVRLFRYLAKWEEHIHLLSMNMVRLLKLFLIMLLFSHWNGCMQYFITSFDFVVHEETGQLELHPDTWVRRANIDAKPPIQQWSWSFFQAMTQLLAISPGVVAPERPAELWLFLASILFGAALYAIFVASLTAVFTELGASGREYRSKIDMLHQYMRNLQMPSELRSKLQTYFELCFPDRQMFHENQILQNLSHPLQSEIALLKCHDVVTALQVLHNENLARQLALNLERVVFVDGDYIIHENDIGRGMYFISSGAVEVFVSGNSTPMTTLGKRSFFGEMALIEPGGKAKGDVRVKGFMEGYILSRDRFELLLEAFPEFKSYIVKVAEMRLAKINQTAMLDEGRRQSPAVAAMSELGEELGEQIELGFEGLSHAKRRLLMKAASNSKDTSMRATNHGAAYQAARPRRMSVSHFISKWRHQAVAEGQTPSAAASPAALDREQRGLPPAHRLPPVGVGESLTNAQADVVDDRFAA